MLCDTVDNCSNISAENWDVVQYPFTRNYIPNCIQDIQDGSEYRKLMQPGQFLSVPEHTGLVLCSDGVPLFKSSGRVTITDIVMVRASFKGGGGAGIPPPRIFCSLLSVAVYMDV